VLAVEALNPQEEQRQKHHEDVLGDGANRAHAKALHAQPGLPVVEVVLFAGPARRVRG
jgi:hypothetical protein